MNPIVLVHGYLGFANVANVEYFKDVKAHLTSSGNTVFEATVDPVGSSQTRADRLKEQIEKNFGRDHVHVVGRTAGGVDARLLVSPDNRNRLSTVDTVTSIGSPHRGTVIATVVRQIRRSTLGPADFPRFMSWAARLFAMQSLIAGPLRDWLGKLITLDDASLKQYTPEEMKIFNQKCRDSESVRYFSYAGACNEQTHSVAPLLILPFLILKAKEGNNDGIVSVESAKWTGFQKAVEADHAEEIGHDLSGLRSSWTKVRAFAALR